ncbi:MAG: hypothetical protein ACOZNI_12030 [Myxococcota bacterium]
MNRKTLIAGAAGALALAATVAIAQTPSNQSNMPADHSNMPSSQTGATSADRYSNDSAVNAPSADTSATDTAATAGERG